MKQYLFFFTGLFSLLFLKASAQVRVDPYAQRFFNALNHYDEDSLKGMLGFDFEYRSDIFPCNEPEQEQCLIGLMGTAHRFLIKYTVQKALNEDQRIFLVEEQSELLHDLGIGNARYKISLTLNRSGKLSGFAIDSTENFYRYREVYRRQSKKFEAWREKKSQKSKSDQYDNLYLKSPEEVRKILQEYKKEQE